MYAVISSGGKQYRVAEGETLTLDKLSLNVGETVEFPVLLLAKEPGGLKVGAPFLSDVRVKASILAHTKGDKIKIIKFRRRKHHIKRMGHRQHYTKIKITEIL